MEIKVTAMHFSWLQILMTSSITEEEESKNQREKETERGAEGVGGRTGEKEEETTQTCTERYQRPQNNFCYLWLHM